MVVTRMIWRLLLNVDPKAWQLRPLLLQSSLNGTCMFERPLTKELLSITTKHAPSTVFETFDLGAPVINHKASSLDGVCMFWNFLFESSCHLPQSKPPLCCERSIQKAFTVPCSEVAPSPWLIWGATFSACVFSFPFLSWALYDIIYITLSCLKACRRAYYLSSVTLWIELNIRCGSGILSYGKRGSI